MDSFIAAVSHKCVGTENGLSDVGEDSVFFRRSCFSVDRQHHSGRLYKLSGGDKVSLSVVRDESSLSIGGQSRDIPEGGTYSR